MAIAKAATLSFLFLLMSILPEPGAWAATDDNQECLQCHRSPDLVGKLPNLTSLCVKPAPFNESVHATNGLGCLDCHSDIPGLGKGKDFPHPRYMAPVKCSSCHDEAAASYLKSVHATARKKGNKMAPLCATCHDYHYGRELGQFPFEKGTNDTCRQCHHPERHHNWLPEKETHLMFIECLVCHTPEPENTILLSLYDRHSGHRVDTSDAIGKLAGSGKSLKKALDQNNNQLIDVEEFHALARVFKIEKLKLEFWGEMTVKTSAQGHRIGVFKKMKDCKTCHASDSLFFNQVYLSVTVPGGTVEHLKMHRDVLSSPLVADFFTVHEAKGVSLDRLGWIFVLGVAGLVGLHLAVRGLTFPLRIRKRK